MEKKQKIDQLTIRLSDPRVPLAQQMIRKLDLYLSDLYPAESNHGPSVSELLHSDAYFYLAYQQQQVVGCGAYKRLTAGVAELKRMFILPQERGKGLGRLLLALLEEAANSEGIRLMRLETGIHQPEAIALYERSGYQTVAPFAPYQPDPLSLFYEKILD